MAGETVSPRATGKERLDFASTSEASAVIGVRLLEKKKAWPKRPNRIWK